MKRITARHRAFVEHYARTHAERESAVAAGYGEKGAAARASELLRDEDISRMVRERQKELCEEQCVTRDFVVLQTLEVLRQCTEGTPHLAWNPDTRQKEPDGTWVFDARGSIQALKLLGELTGALQKETADGGKTEINILLPPGGDREMMK